MLEILKSSPDLVGAYIFVVGLCVGSFLNVVAHRLPIMMKTAWRRECLEYLEQPATEAGSSINLLFPPSRCPHCGHQIRWWENVPVLGWILLRGRCSGCSQKISARYPVVELTTGLLSALAIYVLGVSGTSLLVLPAIWTLIALTLIDLDEQLLPDSMTLPLLWAGLLINLNGAFVPLQSAVLGAVAGYLSLWSVYWIFKLTTGKEGMGYGDFKLLAALGAWMGWQILPLIILLSSLAGAVIGGMFYLVRKQSLPFAFGPYLAIAGLIGLLWREPILRWYLGG